MFDDLEEKLIIEFCHGPDSYEGLFPLSSWACTATRSGYCLLCTNQNCRGHKDSRGECGWEEIITATEGAGEQG